MQAKLVKEFLVKEFLFESVEDKDWDRMADLVLSGKDGASVAKSITNKKKAINRFVAGLKLKNITPKYNPSWKSYSGSFSEFGDKALQLGATPEEIQEVFDQTEIPEKYTGKINNLSGKKLQDRFVGSFVKSLLDAGYDINFLPHNGYAITMDGKEAMQRNGRKWTIGYKTKIEVEGKSIDLVFDAITDEGDGPTSYVIDSSSDTIFRIWGQMGINKFTSTILERLNTFALAERTMKEN